ncbi:MAG: hypothetical protein QXZ68_06590 [Candidatus Bathyarchaeia archaeon]
MIEVSWHAYVAEGEDPAKVTAQLEQGIYAYIRQAHPEALALKQTTNAKPRRTIEDVKKAIPEDLLPLLRIEDSTDYFIITPRQFLGSENFARVMDSIKPLHGEYVSAGKESHFRIPLKA